MRNPFLIPLWAACLFAIAVSVPVDALTRTLWGLVAWAPWIVIMTAAIRRARRPQ